MDATNIQVRWLAARRSGRTKFTSGKATLNTVRALVLTDKGARLLFCGATRPGSVADITAHSPDTWAAASPSIPPSARLLERVESVAAVSGNLYDRWANG